VLEKAESQIKKGKNESQVKHSDFGRGWQGELREKNEREVGDPGT